MVCKHWHTQADVESNKAISNGFGVYKVSWQHLQLEMIGNIGYFPQKKTKQASPNITATRTHVPSPYLKFSTEKL